MEIDIAAALQMSYIWLSLASRQNTQRFQSSLRVLGIDMPRAFNTIKGDMLMTVVESFLGESGTANYPNAPCRNNFRTRQHSHPTLVYHNEAIFRLYS